MITFTSPAHAGRAGVLLALLLGSGSLLAQSFQDLGSVPPYGNATGSAPLSPKFVSADGSVVAGTAGSAGSDGHAGFFFPPANGAQAFVWTQDTGSFGLGVVDPYPLASGFTPVASGANAVSADGSTVVGVSVYQDANSNKACIPFVWTANAGMQFIGAFDSTAPAVGSATDVSADGSVVVGYCSTASGKVHPFRWTQDGGMIDLALDPDVNSYATAVSADGSVVVGVEAGTLHDFFVWTQDAGTTRISVPPGTFSIGSAYVSGDGSTLAGVTEDNNGSQRVRWTADSGLEIVPEYSGDNVSSEEGAAVAGLSYDGSALIESFTANVGGQIFNTHSYRWTDCGDLQTLGFLELGGNRATTTAENLSADGQIIVGTSAGQAFIWSVTDGIWPLQSILNDVYGLGPQLTGWSLRDARAISADGLTIVGTGTFGGASGHAWIAQLPFVFN
ncbi:MAG TPA: hypothetical protein VFB27_11615 [Opitutaceae bacterium]|nr:hypothetical protein [Opitutaceae bacterium]